MDVATNEVKGAMKCKVHYYEDGNVQLETAKELDDKLTKGTSEPVRLTSCLSPIDIDRAFILSSKTLLQRSNIDDQNKTITSTR